MNANAASPYMTSSETQAYLRLPSLGALYHHIRENGLPVCRVGGRLLFDRRDIDAWVRNTSALELARSRRSA